MTGHRFPSGGFVEGVGAGDADADDPVDPERREVIREGGDKTAADALPAVIRVDHHVQDVRVAHAVGERPGHAEEPSGGIERRGDRERIRDHRVKLGSRVVLREPSGGAVEREDLRAREVLRDRERGLRRPVLGIHTERTRSYMLSATTRANSEQRSSTAPYI